MIAKLLISSSLESRLNAIEQYLATNSLKINQPDIFYLKAGEKIGVGEAKKIKEHLSIKPFMAKGRIVIIEDANVITIEAQNSLLKTIEELPETALFILGVNSEQSLLPTVISRCEIVILNDQSPLCQASEASNLDIGKLVNSTLEERFEYIEKTKDKEEFLKALIAFWREKLLQNPTKETKNFVEELLMAEKWMQQNVNPRAILEYLMLKIPGTL